MPHAFLLHLTPTTLTPRHPYLHLYTHGLFYHLLETIDPDLSAQVHAAARNPFTLWVREEQEGGVLLRVTTLNDALFQPLLAVVLQESLSGLELGQDSYRVARVLATPEGHPDAGFMSWQDLLGVPATNKLELRFLTPTVFSTSRTKKRRYTPLPDPRLITKSLLRAYQTYSPVPYSVPEMGALEVAFAEQLFISRHDICTRPHTARKTKLTGFVGRATIGYQDSAVQVTTALGRLATLAFFSGLGAKTPYGMGQVRVTTEEATSRAARRRG